MFFFPEVLGKLELRNLRSGVYYGKHRARSPMIETADECLLTIGVSTQ